VLHVQAFQDGLVVAVQDDGFVGWVLEPAAEHARQEPPPPVGTVAQVLVVVVLFVALKAAAKKLELVVPPQELVAAATEEHSMKATGKPFGSYVREIQIPQSLPDTFHVGSGKEAGGDGVGEDLLVHVVDAAQNLVGDALVDLVVDGDGNLHAIVRRRHQTAQVSLVVIVKDADKVRSVHEVFDKLRHLAWVEN